MSLVIIGEVKLMQVQSSQLKWDPTGHPLWFNGVDQDLYLVISEDEVRHFEISWEDKIISGGATKALQYGIITGNNQGIGQTLSRIVDYQKEIPDHSLEMAIKIINSCENLEETIKNGLLTYLNGHGFGPNPLRFSKQLQSYLPLEKREYKVRKNHWREFRKALPNHLGLKIVLPISVVLIVFAIFTTYQSSKLQLLDMADRMTISYIDRLSEKEADFSVVDENKMGLLHYMSLSLTTNTNENYLAFKYLVEAKKLDINSFDLNGRTPLYYLVTRFLSSDTDDDPPPPNLALIKAFIDLGAKPKLKNSPKDLSAWDLGRQNIELRELFMHVY